MSLKQFSTFAANLPLIRENLSPLSFVGVPERAYVEGMFGVYELNRIELLCDVFVWAYECSRARFIEVIEVELMSLHEGNIGRYRFCPSQYQIWRETWR